MPRDILGKVPAVIDLFLDANIFVYAFTGRSKECTDLLDRCARQEVFGITSRETIHELTHRLMLTEAFDKGLIAKPRADKLRAKPDVIRSLTDYWMQVSQVFSMNLTIVGTTDSIVLRAQAVRSAHGLMTLDSVLVATLEEFGIQHLASHDNDFVRVPTLTVYHATDIP